MPEDRLYTRAFVQVLVGAMLTMVGVSMQFHFGEYIAWRGYQENVLGWITGVGAMGSLLLRPYVGPWIDRLGSRRCFAASALVAGVANLCFPFVNSLPLIYLLRVVVASSTATFLATVAVYAAQAAPEDQRAESLGTIGIGGFLGMMIGPALGDLIFGNVVTERSMRDFFIVVAAAHWLGGAAACVVREHASMRDADRDGFFPLIVRYWPGRVLLTPIVFAAALTVQMTFLERFAHQRGFDDIRWFFLAYASTAVAHRLIFRQVPQRFGRRRVCAVGMFVFAVGLLLLIPVRSAWQLVIPALLMGTGHSYTFPSMVDLVCQAMPLRHRGVATSLALGFMDIGFLTFGVAWGQTIHRFGYEAMFACAALTTGVAATWLLFAGHSVIERPRRGTGA